MNCSTNPPRPANDLAAAKNHASYSLFAMTIEMVTSPCLAEHELSDY